MGPLAAILLAASGAAPGVLSVRVVVEPACRIRSAAEGVVVVCAGRTPHVISRPGAQPQPEGGGPAAGRPRVTISF
ncbi:MAG TPA: hypothetical protein VF699_11380 [Caulobacteraceae bacterium]|jgi:hypothetical protein